MVWLWANITTGHLAKTGNRPRPREADATPAQPMTPRSPVHGSQFSGPGAVSDSWFSTPGRDGRERPEVHVNGGDILVGHVLKGGPGHDLKGLTGVVIVGPVADYGEELMVGQPRGKTSADLGPDVAQTTEPNNLPPLKYVVVSTTFGF